MSSFQRTIKRLVMSLLLPVHALARGLDLARPGVAVLMYHAVGDTPWEFSVSQQTFARQIELLSKWGFQFLSLDEFARVHTGSLPLPPRSVLLTFDDGYRNCITHAFPVLQERGIRPVIFLHTTRSGAELGTNLELMTWEDVRGVQRAVDIGSHSHSHPVLRTLQEDELAEDIAQSTLICERELGVRPISFAYPGGKYNHRVIEAVRRAGYTMAFTIRHGLVRPHDDALQLRRIGITKHTSDVELYAHAIGVGEWYARIVHGTS